VVASAAEPIRVDEPKTELTPLQRHAAYFDPEGTGLIRFGQTYRGLRDLGVGRGWSVTLSSIIHAALGRRTSGGLLTIRIANIHRGKHDSDTGVFDASGKLVDARFEALFASIAHTDPPNVITRKEFRSFMKQSGPQSAAGTFFSWAEAKLFFCVAADTEKREDGKTVPAIRRATLRSFYEGDLLPRVARLRKLRDRRADRGKR
jgi:peroxygenase